GDLGERARRDGRRRAGVPQSQRHAADRSLGAPGDRSLGGGGRRGSRRSSPYAAAHFRHPPAGERRRPAGHPGAAGAQLALHDAEVHPSRGGAAALGLSRRPSASAARVRWSGMTERRFICTPGGAILRGQQRLRRLLVGLALLLVAVAVIFWLSLLLRAAFGVPGGGPWWPGLFALLAATVPWLAWRMSGDLDL